MPDQDNTPTTGSVTLTTPSESAASTGMSSMLQDNTGGVSATRVLMLSWGLGVLVVWAFATVMAVIHGVYTGISIPESVVTVLLGIVFGKVVQRPFEK